MNGARICIFTMKGDSRGNLVAIEGNIDLDFQISRVFYIFNSSPQIIRGKHANRRSKICFIAVAGTCRIVVDNGKEREEFLMDTPSKGLLCDSMTWKEMKDFSSDCVLLGISDLPYDEGEYITDYDAFLKEINHG